MYVITYKTRAYDADKWEAINGTFIQAGRLAEQRQKEGAYDVMVSEVTAKLKIIPDWEKVT